ncbi:MAG TPA: pitrilysin family protein, partial [Chloroflexota bacterium]|nr:pitrilysin family protein [Chloroflexota bacterium]
PGSASVEGESLQGISLNVERVQLDNGIVLLCSQDSSLPQVVIRANLEAGSLFDTKETEGIARFVAPMLIRGSTEHSFQELSEETDGLGMGLSSDAGRLTAQVSLRCLSEDFSRATEFLAEVLRRPTFPQEEIDKLRSQIISALREQDMSPRAVAERRFLEELYPVGHPYRLWPSGNQESITHISRDDIVQFYRRHYRPDSLTIAIVGDVTPDAAIEQIKRVLGDWKAEGQPPAVEIPSVDLPARMVTELAVPGKFQSEMVMGLPAIPRKHPDYYALRLGNLILGELGLSGRLGANIRDQKGLAYHVSSDLQASLGPSPWAIRAGINPANVDRAIEAAEHEIGRWKSELVGEAEIEDGKRFLIGSLPIALETSDGIARTLLDIEFYDLGLDYLQRYPNLIGSVTREAIRDAVQRWIHPEHMAIVVAGPKRG